MGEDGKETEGLLLGGDGSDEAEINEEDEELYAITIKHADGFNSHINIFFGELIDATHYCEGLKELNSKFGVHGEIYRIHDIGPNGIHIVREYKCGQWGPFMNEEDEK